MPCEHDQEALIDAAASGATLPPQVRDHVEACADCRAALAAEQTLFAAIDSNLRRTASAELPPSFLHRVRASVANETTPGRVSIPRWAMATASAAVLLSLFAAHNFRQSPRRPLDEQAAANRTPAPINPTEPSPTSPIPAPSIKSAPTLRRHPLPVSSRANSQEPEVLVPPGEEALLVRFYQTFRGAADQPVAVVAEAHDTEPKPLTIAPLEFTELDIKTLDERDVASK